LDPVFNWFFLVYTLLSDFLSLFFFLLGAPSAANSAAAGANWRLLSLATVLATAAKAAKRICATATPRRASLPLADAGALMSALHRICLHRICLQIDPHIQGLVVDKKADAHRTA
jgi:hypothetical protein